MKLSFQKTAAAAAIAASMALTACVDSTDFPAIEPTPPPPPPVETENRISISGKAVKGTLVNAGVEVLDLNGDTIATADAPTGDDGSYTVSFLSNDPVPFIVRIFATEDTTMSCDVSGCGDDAVTGLTGLELTTVGFAEPTEVEVGEEPEAVVANLSTLTTLATESIVAQVADSTVALTATDIVEAQTIASSVVTELLDLPATNLFTLDLGDADAESDDFELVNAAFGGTDGAAVATFVSETAEAVSVVAVDTTSEDAIAELVILTTNLQAVVQEVIDTATEIGVEVPVIEAPTQEEIQQEFEELEDEFNTGSGAA